MIQNYRISFMFLLTFLYMQGSFAQDELEVLDTYYPQGTRWTELKLDTLKYDSWYHKNPDGTYCPNYERTDFYIHGDTTRASTKYMKVWRHIEGQPDSVALLIKNWEIPRVVISSLYFRSYGSIAAPCPVYDFQWETARNSIVSGYPVAK